MPWFRALLNVSWKAVFACIPKGFFEGAEKSITNEQGMEKPMLREESQVSDLFQLVG